MRIAECKIRHSAFSPPLTPIPHFALRIFCTAFRNPRSAIRIFCSPFASKGDEIVQVEQIEDGLDVVPIRRKFLDRTAQEFATFIIRGATVELELGPSCNFKIGSFPMLANPNQNLGIRFSFFQKLEDILGAHPGKAGEALIEPAVEMVVASFAGELSASFVQHAGQDHVSTERYARTARRALSEVDGVHGD
jgi:hypothetical protein